MRKLTKAEKSHEIILTKLYNYTRHPIVNKNEKEFTGVDYYLICPESGKGYLPYELPRDFYNNIDHCLELIQKVNSEFNLHFEYEQGVQGHHSKPFCTAKFRSYGFTRLYRGCAWEEPSFGLAVVKAVLKTIEDICE